MGKTYFNWSSGKDSSMALHQVLEEGKLKVDKLLTSVNSHHQRVSMHGLHVDVLKAQAASIGIPLDLLEIPEKPSMDDYNKLMKSKVDQLVQDGFTDTVFGDIFLEDLKKYREAMLEPYGINAHFPIWKRDTKELLHSFIDKGFKAVIVCINNSLLDESFLGRTLDESFLDDLPDNVDPCGENGEFHTFCYDGPIFKQPVSFQIGEKIFRTYDDPKDSSNNIQFGFCDILLSSSH